MEFRNILKEDLNSQNFFKKDKLFQINSFDLPNSQILKVNNGNKENLKSILKNSKMTTGDTVLDMSMLSLKEDEEIKVYYLPESDKLKNKEDIDIWVENMKSRRINNRLQVYHHIEKIKPILADLSFDEVTGERYIVQTHDHRMELEMSKFPLGKNFLNNTKITCKHRSTMIDCLFNLAYMLKTDRYTVGLAMAYADRYVKIKGEKMPLVNYKFMVMSCWFLACKYDLIYYPSMEDICDVMQISSQKIVLDFEVDIIQTIDYYLGITAPIDFLRPLTLLKQRKQVSHNIAKFFLDVCLYSYDLAGHPSHMIAAACYCLSLAICLRIPSVEETWIALMKMYTGLDIKDIKPIIELLGITVATANFEEEFPALYKENTTVIEVLSKRHADILSLSRI